MLPAPQVLVDLGRLPGLALAGEKVFDQDYVRTLGDWRTRFRSAWPSIEQMGFDERFRRLWEYYLAYSEAGFRSGMICLPASTDNKDNAATPSSASPATRRAVGADRLVNGISILLIAIFFATSADSGTLVINTILSDGSRTLPASRRVAWSIGIGLLTAALILAGGIRILQQTVVLAAIAFSIVLAAIAAGLFRALMDEEQGVRQGRKRRRPRQPWSGTDEPD